MSADDLSTVTMTTRTFTEEVLHGAPSPNESGEDETIVISPLPPITKTVARVVL